MKVIAINGSPRKNGNTRQALEIVLRTLQKHGIETELIQLGGKNYYGCQACDRCKTLLNGHCAIDDGMNFFLDKIREADGVLIGSPTYHSNVTAEVKALMDRAGYVARFNGRMFKGKVGAPVVAVRRSGGNFTYAAINYFFGIAQMPIATSDYWNMTLARNPGEIQQDEEGIRTFEILGDNMAEMLKGLALQREQAAR